MAAALGVFLALVFLATSTTILTSASAHPTSADIPVVPGTVIATYPHDRRAFTQGLAIADGIMYEGTGSYGESALRQVDLTTGGVVQETRLPSNLFGEGIAVIGDRIAQLTWQSHLGLVYDRASFASIGSFNYPTEGWGLTFDGVRLILSDGSATLRFLDPESFAELGRVQVQANGRPVTQLNELEYLDGMIFANVWMSDRIAIIHPGTGEVCLWLDLSLLNPVQQATRDEVLNGIAFDADARRLFVTGKRWPTLFELELTPDLVYACEQPPGA